MNNRLIVYSLALIAVFIAGTKPPGLPHSIQPGTIVSLALLPVWLPHVRRYVGGIAIPVGAVVTAFAGAMLAWYTATHTLHVIASDALSVYIVRLAGLALILPLLLWARETIGAGLVGASYGLGLLATNMLGIPDSNNPWKFELSIPLTIIVLGILHRKGVFVSVGALFALAIVGAVNDSRSYAGLAAFTALLLLVDRLRRVGGKTWNRLGMALVVLGAAAALYYAATELLVQGVLGEEIATRTQTQLDQSGNLIVGGRPEWAATLKLATIYPFGLGAGIVPMGSDTETVKNALASVGIPTYIGYVEHYMTAGSFRLHSITADLWMGSGLVGLAYALLMLWMLGYIVVTRVARTGVTALRGYLLVNCAWFLLFGPLYTDLPFLALAFGLTLVDKNTLRTSGPHPVEPNEHDETDEPDTTTPELLHVNQQTPTPPAN